MLKDVNNLFIISGPSGSGQDSIIEAVGKKFPIERIITSTTREKRSGEENGKPYYFLTEEEFEDGIYNDLFFEWAKHYNNNYYGVSYNEIQRVSESSKIGIWKVDKKGVETAKKILPNIKAILIYAPIEQLEKRIRARDKDLSEEYIQERMEYSRGWLENTDIYDFKVLNEDGDLDKAVAEVEKIIKEFI